MSRTEEQKNNIREWVKALRSGDYEQGQNWLKFITVDMKDNGENVDKPTYCCLGVICELHNALKPESDTPEHWMVSDTGMSYPVYSEFIEWTGIDEETIDGFISHLVQCNDTDNMNFDEIAAEIEGWFPDVFDGS